MVRVLEEYAKNNNIPIMISDGIEFMLNYIKQNNIKSVLEIGTAIGYSAIRICLETDAVVTTIERDKKRYDLAIKNIHDFKLDGRIEAILDDAFNVNLNKKYDLIFIDAAKSQYIKFFLKFKENLSDKGVILSDNLDFHGLVKKDLKEIESRNVRGLVRKLNDYITFLKENEEFKTTFYDVGDGISISERI